MGPSPHKNLLYFEIVLVPILSRHTREREMMNNNVSGAVEELKYCAAVKWQELDKCDIRKSEWLRGFPFSKEDKVEPQMGSGGKQIENICRI